MFLGAPYDKRTVGTGRYWRATTVELGTNTAKYTGQLPANLAAIVLTGALGGGGGDTFYYSGQPKHAALVCYWGQEK